MKTIFLKLFTIITGLSKDVWEFLEPILKDEAGKIFKAALPIALEIVKALMSKDMDKNAKKDLAVKELKEALIKEGIEAGTNILNIAVETAVAKVKASQK